MLNIAKKRIDENRLKIPLFREDYQLLENTFSGKFDAVVCLTNAINEPEVDVIKALNSMKNVLSENGIIVFDQGQTDFMMKINENFKSLRMIQTKQQDEYHIRIRAKSLEQW